METTYQVHITPQAQQQLKEISNYISTELKSKEIALHLLSLFETAISSLSVYPKRISLTEEEPWHSKGIHKMPVKNFLVYFWVNEDTSTVHIIAVIYVKRDQIFQLSKMNLE